MQGTLEEKGPKQGLDVIGNMALINTSSHTRNNFSEKYLQFGHAPTISFVSHVLGRKIIKNIRLNGARNYLPARGAYPTVSVSHLHTNRLVCFHTLFCFLSSPIFAFISFVPVICCFIYFHLKSWNAHIANDMKTGEVLVERTVCWLPSTGVKKHIPMHKYLSYKGPTQKNVARRTQWCCMYRIDNSAHYLKINVPQT